MSTKSEKIQKAANGIKKITLYHIMGPIDDKQLNKIKTDGYFEPSKSTLGGQSNGYYFFTTYTGAQHHIETNKDSWTQDADKHAYIFECEIDLSSVKYPDWKLDYEAMQDFLFDMVYTAVRAHPIKVDGIKIDATDDGKLTILDGTKFSKIKSFSPDKHSGLLENISDFLYKHNQQFHDAYDKLLMDVFLGTGENQELYAVKTTNKHKITKITEIDRTPTTPQKKPMSQSDKFWARYGKPPR